MTRPALVTVVIPTYNYGIFLEDAVSSAAQQDYEALEILVVDDGSTDNTGEVLERLRRQIPALRVITTAHLGVSNARNVGTQAAKGTYVAYLDADDIWHPTKIEKQVAALEAHAGDPEWVAVYSLFRIIDREGVITDSAPAFETRGYCFANHLIVNHIGNGSGMLVRRDVVLEIGGFDTKYALCEDIDLQLRILKHYKIEVVREYLVGYRHHKKSATTRHVEMAQAVTETIDRHASDPQIPQSLRDATRVSSYRYVWHKYLRGQHYRSAIQVLLKALWAEPFATMDDISQRFRGAFRRRARLAYQALSLKEETTELPLFLATSPLAGVSEKEPKPQARISKRFACFDKLLYERFVNPGLKKGRCPKRH
ncbi:MAG: glycosyltransferase [Pseudomonadota bacterium]